MTTSGAANDENLIKMMFPFSCLCADSLRHGRRDKMASSLQTFSNAFSCMKIIMKFIVNGPINNEPSLFQAMARRRTGDSS